MSYQELGFIMTPPSRGSKRLKCFKVVIPWPLNHFVLLGEKCIRRLGSTPREAGSQTAWISGKRSWWPGELEDGLQLWDCSDPRLMAETKGWARSYVKIWPRLYSRNSSQDPSHPTKRWKQSSGHVRSWVHPAPMRQCVMLQRQVPAWGDVMV